MGRFRVGNQTKIPIHLAMQEGMIPHGWFKKRRGPRIPAFLMSLLRDKLFASFHY